MRIHTLVLGLVVTLPACSEEVGGSSNGDGGAGAGQSTGPSGGGQGGVDVSDQGTLLEVDVTADGLTLVDLDAGDVVDSDDPATEGWELAFSGYDLFTNSGLSGPASGGAFGPLSVTTFLVDSAPDVPFVLDDRAGGAFLRWYAYEGSIHALWTRYHVYGIRVEDELFKLQVLSYYGELQGAPVSAIYQLRWAEVTAGGMGPTTTIEDLDGTAGGLAGGDEDPSGCLDLKTGERFALNIDQAATSTDWHICFRRDAISVNGELGGPGSAGAVDVTRQERPDELPLEEVKAKTPASELAAFDAIDHQRLSRNDLVYRGDRIVSAFDTAWYTATTPREPADAVWYVQSSDGERSFLIFVERFEGAGDDTPGTVHLRFKEVTGN